MALLTDKTAFTGTLNSLDLIHVVDVSDTTDDAAGSSFKLTLLKLFTFIATGKFTAYAGGGQGSATALTAADNLVETVATAGDSVKMPAATVGAKIRVRVKSSAAASADIFPQTGENFAGLSANVAIPATPGTIIDFVCFTAGEWEY